MRWRDLKGLWLRWRMESVQKCKKCMSTSKRKSLLLLQLAPKKIKFLWRRLRYSPWGERSAPRFGKR
jgi:hypothetical protein